jgi:hypothetical protein
MFGYVLAFIVQHWHLEKNAFQAFKKKINVKM